MSDVEEKVHAEVKICLLRKALEWYADPISYAITQIKEPRSAVHEDQGRRARAALEGRAWSAGTKDA